MGERKDAAKALTGCRGGRGRTKVWRCSGMCKDAGRLGQDAEWVRYGKGRKALLS